MHRLDDVLKSGADYIEQVQFGAAGLLRASEGRLPDGSDADWKRYLEQLASLSNKEHIVGCTTCQARYETLLNRKRSRREFWELVRSVAAIPNPKMCSNLVAACILIRTPSVHTSDHVRASLKRLL